MSINQKIVYRQATSKLRRLWETAIRLIAQYEDFDRRLTAAEERMRNLSKRISSTIDGV